MLTNGSGVIVNTASTASHHGVPGMASYNASKHGLLGLTRAAALEVIRSGIRVNCLTPGLIETPILGDFLNRSGDTGALDAIRAGIPLGRTGRPEEAAAAALWLASDQSSFVYGHSLIAAGGELV
jgi:NAD(P)-dependent dehydrogenase (short-subunit alcohol dehydrogenase family)